MLFNKIRDQIITKNFALRKAAYRAHHSLGRREENMANCWDMMLINADPSIAYMQQRIRRNLSVTGPDSCQRIKIIQKLSIILSSVHDSQLTSVLSPLYVKDKGLLRVRLQMDKWHNRSISTGATLCRLRLYAGISEYPVLVCDRLWNIPMRSSKLWFILAMS